MDVDRLKSFQTAPIESAYRCEQCGNVLHLKKGQLVPPCPKCGFRQFERTEAPAQC